jgi:calcineurin-like phosphoesterase family protein
MEWFMSDTHFNHEAILRAHNRPFKSVVDMDETMLENINRVVKETDTLYHLGDFCLGSVENGIKFRKRIKCDHVYLIYGNHDEKNRAFKEFRKAFGNGKCHDILEIRRDGRLYVMCHYPILYPHHWDKGAWVLHGHMHGEGMVNPVVPSVDVGVDIWNYHPISMEDIQVIVQAGINKMPYEERYAAFVAKKKEPNE